MRWLRWAGGEWTAGGAPRGAPWLAESWLVADGRVRALDAHAARFAAGWRALRADEAPGGLWAAVAAALPEHGRWFPRLDLRGDGAPDLRLALRPAPAPALTVTAWVCDVADPREHPRRKGPELELLAGLRARAGEQGAQEALLAGRDGRLLEGALSSLLWWEGDALCAVPCDAPILPGVTRGLLLALARREGVAVRLRRPRPDELAGREVWLTSALHGIRAVVPGGPATLAAGAPTRAVAWQRRLEALSRRAR